jgi:hypothetical protein
LRNVFEVNLLVQEIEPPPVLLQKMVQQSLGGGMLHQPLALWVWLQVQPPTPISMEVAAECVFVVAVANVLKERAGMQCQRGATNNRDYGVYWGGNQCLLPRPSPSSRCVKFMLVPMPD